MSAVLDGMLTQTISYKLPTSTSDYGDPTYGSASTAKAMVEEHEEKVVLANGTEERSSHRVAVTTDIDVAARIWLPGASTSDQEVSLRILRRRKAVAPHAAVTLWEHLLA